MVGNQLTDQEFEQFDNEFNMNINQNRDQKEYQVKVHLVNEEKTINRNIMVLKISILSGKQNN